MQFLTDIPAVVQANSKFVYNIMCSIQCGRVLMVFGNLTSSSYFLDVNIVCQFLQLNEKINSILIITYSLLNNFNIL